MADCEVIGAVLTADPISEDDAIAAVEGAEAGAVVSFRGVVRNHDGGRPVKCLSYTAHPTGTLQIGDVALVCAVSAAHRRQAFTVCSELVDRIKAGVPIWKEQVFNDGSVEWVGADEPMAGRTRRLQTETGQRPALHLPAG